MPILTQDIKLLKSAVMADTTDGGGAMTGIEVVDGQSNNLFPDTSAMDRAFGRVNLRKVFGVAHTGDTATLMGAHAIITDAPDDPLVHCSLLKTAGWADTRTTAREAIEKYLVKGPRLSPRLYDAHYSGSLQIRLISFVNATFPAGGDAIVLRTPAGLEQYVRILNVSVATENVAVVENGNVLVLAAQVATCDIGQELAYDFFGPPPARVVSEASYATLWSTTRAGGAKFYGIKPLGVAGNPGDLVVTTAGGIFNPLVPAATVESPIIDQYPLRGRSSVIPTATAAVTLPGVAVSAFGPNSVVTLPTAIEPKSLALTHGATAFTDDGTGTLLQGTLAVGTVDYRAGTATLLAGAPSYGSGTQTVTYRPATVAGASAFSASFTITVANQGLAFTNVFEPPPAPGSFTLAYMAQGRWYELKDNFNGKLEGADSSYGTGTINYATGSMSVTLGAIPDVDSLLIADWGDPSAAKKVDSANTPLKAGLRVVLNALTKGDEISVAWSRGGTNYSASTNAAGVLTGNATGNYANGVLTFEPTVFPDGDVTITSKLAPTSGGAFTNNGGGSYTLTGTLPVVKGSFRAKDLITYPGTVVPNFADSPLPLYDADGVIYTNYRGQVAAVGTINYATGAVIVNSSVNLTLANRTTVNVVGWQGGATVHSSPLAVTSVTLQAPITDVSYAGGAATTDVQTVTPSAWVIAVVTNGPALLVDGSVFRLGSDFYTAVAGALRRGWNLATGLPVSTAAGTISNDGTISVTSLPADFANGLSWYNVAQDTSAKQVEGGVFRTASAPLKTGVYQMQVGASVGSANDAGVISGGGFSGTVDYQRGVVNWASTAAVDPSLLSYNAVFLQYLPLDGTLLGLETARLPLDGKVPIYRSADLLVVHNALSLTLPNPLVKDTAYDMGRERIASVRVKDALGVVVPDTLYTTDLNAGTLTVPTASNITAYSQPFTVEHRIEDMVVCSKADISGKLTILSRLTHNFPANTSFVSSALPFGDLFARVHNYIEQATWTNEWSDSRIGAPILANFNEAQFPIVVTNKGAITERWAIIFTNTTSYRVVGESVGEIGTGSTGADCSPINPATNVPYFSIPATGWGAGWATGNVLRHNTAACGSPFWPVRTVLQGPASLDSDKFTLAFRGDVDRP